MKETTTAAVCDNGYRGRVIRNKRMSICLAIRHLAEQLQISTAHLSAMERGEKKWTETRYRMALIILKHLGAK